MTTTPSTKTFDYKKLFFGAYQYYELVHRELMDILHDPYIPKKTRRRIAKLTRIRLDINWRDNSVTTYDSVDRDPYRRDPEVELCEYDNRKPVRETNPQQGELL